MGSISSFVKNTLWELQNGIHATIINASKRSHVITFFIALMLNRGVKVSAQLFFQVWEEQY